MFVARLCREACCTPSVTVDDSARERTRVGAASWPGTHGVAALCTYPELGWILILQVWIWQFAHLSALHAGGVAVRYGLVSPESGHEELAVKALKRASSTAPSSFSLCTSAV